MRIILAAAGLLLLVSGCAGTSRELGGTPEKAPPLKSRMQQATSDNIVCEVERTVGTWIPETVCRSVEQSERHQRQTQDILNTSHGPASTPGATGGGR